MRPKNHKPDLVGADCVHLEVGFFVPAEDGANEEILKNFSGISAVATYSRRRSTHTCFLAHRHDPDGGIEYKCRWFLSSVRRTNLKSRGDPWSALELGFNSINQLDIRCVFVTANDVIPTLIVPASPFANGVMPFNKILGYRVAQTEKDQDSWSAIVDSIDNGERFQVSVFAEQCPISSAFDARQALNYCCSIRDRLLIPKPPQDPTENNDD